VLEGIPYRAERRSYSALATVGKTSPPVLDLPPRDSDSQREGFRSLAKRPAPRAFRDAPAVCWVAPLLGLIHRWCSLVRHWPGGALKLETRRDALVELG
jgi:hypothetical protein